MRTLIHARPARARADTEPAQPAGRDGAPRSFASHAAFAAVRVRPWALLAVAVALAAAAPATAAPPQDPDGPDPGPPTGVPNRPPTVVSKVAIDGRAALSGRRWSPIRDQYLPSYVNPSSWKLRLNGCKSKGGTNASGHPIRIRSYQWRIEPLEEQPGQIRRNTGGCRSHVSLSTLGPKEHAEAGRWRVHLTIHTVAGRTLRTQRDQTFRDVVIIAVGDSYVSGEGNPERHSYITGGGPNQPPPRRVPAKWSDRQCHRSSSSWAMRAARAFENASTSVTFLNYACSGATVDNVLGSYRGMEPVSGDKRLPAQLVAAGTALGNPLAASTRPVHTVLMSAGVNDAEFSSVLRDCAKVTIGLHIDPLFGDPCNRVGPTRYVRNKIAGLRESYDRLEVGLAANLKGGAVRFLEYPSRILTDAKDRHGGCGIFEGITSDEAGWITDRGDELNARMVASAALHGWSYVGGVRDAFRRHGYCAGSRTWFRSFSGSSKLQANESGTAHPLGAGHAAAGRLAVRTIPAATPAVPPAARLKIEFTRVRVDDPAAPPVRRLPVKEPPRMSFGVVWGGTRAVPADRLWPIPIGEWVDVPDAERVFSVDTVGNTVGLIGFITLPALRIDDEDAANGFLTTGLRRLGSFVLHRRADRWRTGTHTLMAREGNGASMQIEYRVSELPYDPGFLEP